MITRTLHLSCGNSVSSNLDTEFEKNGSILAYPAYGSRSGTSSDSSYWCGCATLSGSTTTTFTLNNAAKAILFKGTTTSPVKVGIKYTGCLGTNSSNVYIQLTLGGTQYFKFTQGSVGSALYPSFPSGAHTTEKTCTNTLTQSSEMVFTLKRQRTSQWGAWQVVDLTFYFDEEPTGVDVSMTYDGATITLAEAHEDDVNVVYDGKTIATGSVVLACAGKIMKTDVVVVGKTIKCSGKVMKSNIVIEVVS